ncbi:MAG: DUF3800 domain-containing protein [Chloroflexi bacterium]|nr:DUF3800 domain-containing protein [Chloroflexota bacterium]
MKRKDHHQITTEHRRRRCRSRGRCRRQTDYPASAKRSGGYYREAVARLVAHCVARWPRIDLFLDKRYTKKSLRRELELVIREGVVHLPQEVVLIRQEDSRNSKGLQAVDFVAWAIYQKYEADDERFYAIIQDKIIVEETIQHHLW